jgi:hypothetical protein
MSDEPHAFTEVGLTTGGFSFEIRPLSRRERIAAHRANWHSRRRLALYWTPRISLPDHLLKGTFSTEQWPKWPVSTSVSWRSAWGEPAKTDPD